MFVNVILLVIGFIILIKGADFFVDGASGIAGNFKVSKILIGLTIVEQVLLNLLLVLNQYYLVMVI
jgi:Ca2+/Na+ antiporter